MSLLGARVLVTGGAGFIGTALAKRHSEAAAEWVAYDNLLEQVHGPAPQLDLPSAARLVIGDVRDREALGATIASLRPDVVIHLAAETGTGQSLDQPTRHTEVNVTGTATLFEALGSHAPLRLVLTSSRAVYGEGEWVDAQGVAHRPGPRSAQMLAAGMWNFPDLQARPSAAGRTWPTPCNIYGATKLAQENLITSWAAARGVSTSVVRLQNVYGPGQSPRNPYTGITTLFVQLARAGEVIPVYEDGQIIRDFVFIDDVVQAISTAAAAEGNVLADVGSGRSESILEMAQLCAQLFDAPEPVITGQFRLGDVRHAACDMSGSGWVRAGRDPVSLSDGLSQLAGWISASTPARR